MNRLDHRKLIHQASQPYIKMESASLMIHLERTKADPLTKQICESLILALKDKNELANLLYEENERLKAVANEAAK